MEDNIGSILADVSRLMRRTFDEKARGIGITRPQWMVLTVLRRQEGINQAGIAELLDMEPITLCRMIDRMQVAGLVERRRDPNDRRAWQLFLTERARELIRQLRPLGMEVMAMALEGIADAEREQLRNTLNRIRQNLSRRGDESSNPIAGATKLSEK